MEYKRIKNDVNGNPRYVFHFFGFLTDAEINTDLPTEEKYKLAHERAKKLGFRKYRGKDFGGGFVCQSYNINLTIKEIEKEKNRK